MLTGLPFLAAVISLLLAPGAAQPQVTKAAEVKPAPATAQAKGQAQGQAQGQSVGAPPAEQAIQPPATTSQKFGDWVYECAPSASGKPVCGLSQIIYAKKHGERLMAAYLLPSSRDKDSKKAYLILYLPFGVDVQSDVYLSVGTGPRAAGKVETCLQAGCRVSFALNDEGLETFRRGTSATVVFEPYNGSTTAYDLSLIGFSQGYKALSDSRG
jgi:invasion protein IalB